MYELHGRDVKALLSSKGKYNFFLFNSNFHTPKPRVTSQLC